MQGRSDFTPAEAEEIRSLLRAIRRSDRPEQKGLRRQLRSLGFYITDFASDQRGFTAADFDALVARRSVTISSQSADTDDE